MSTVSERETPLDSPVFEGFPVIDTEDHIDWQNRLRVINQEYGFLPMYRSEITAVSQLTSDISTARDTIGHLNEVLVHQKTHGFDIPKSQSAVRSKVREFGQYLVDANDRGSRLITLHQQLADSVYPRLSLVTAEFSTHRGLIDLLQFLDVQGAVETGNPHALDSKIKKDDERTVLANRYDHAFIDETLMGVMVRRLTTQSVQEVKEATADAVASQQKRKEFWIQRLQKSRRHMVASSIAKKILEQFED